MDFLYSLLAATVRLSVPILLAASGEVLAQRGGVINIGLEGVMLSGASYENRPSAFSCAGVRAKPS